MTLACISSWTSYLFQMNIFYVHFHCRRRYNSYIQMGKRKHDCSLDKIVIECLKRAKHERTLKLFQKQNRNQCNKAIYSDFVAFLKNSVVKENKDDDDDLGFEINFGAFQRETKVRFEIHYKYSLYNIDYII